MKYEERKAVLADSEILANLRVASMEESLKRIGRFDPITARNRFLNNFNPDETTLILINSEIIGFYVVQIQADCFYLSHLYLLAEFQSYGIGSKIISAIKANAIKQNLIVKVGALRDSKSNDFYKNNGFHKTHEDEWDLHYETRL